MRVDCVSQLTLLSVAGNKCYYVSDGDPCLWGEAKARCEELGPGSRLGSIHSRLEQGKLKERV